MAIDLLRPSERADNLRTHLPRFDLESLFYVLLWRACCPNDKDRKQIRLPSDHDHNLKKWRTAKWDTLQKEKSSLM
jgi:hypothetical protein